MTRDSAQKLLDEISEKLGEHCSAFTLFAEFEEEDEGTFVGTQAKGSLSHVFGLASRNTVEIEEQIRKHDAFSRRRDDDQEA